MADYANNTTGLCWPEMETLAWLLKRSVRTIQRHVHKLEELGLVEIVERRRRFDGTFLGYLFRLPHIARAAERIRERKKANEEANEERKREQQEARERKRKRRLSHRRERDASRSSTASSQPISGEQGARRRREGYEHLFESAPSSPSSTAAEQLRDAPPPSPEPSDFPASSTGHPRPLAPIYATSRSNHFPPNPPTRGTADRRKEAMVHPTNPVSRKGGALPEGHTPAELAWLGIRHALLEAHPDLDRRQLAVRSVTLGSKTLTVALRDAPIMSFADPLSPKQVGSTAQHVRSRYGGELSRLRRELSGDPHALLDLSPAS